MDDDASLTHAWRKILRRLMRAPIESKIPLMLTAHKQGSFGDAPGFVSVMPNKRELQWHKKVKKLFAILWFSA